MKRLLIIGGILVTVLIVVVVLTKGRGGEATRVATDKAEKRSIIEIVSASGKVQPEVEVKISSGVSGEIVELLVKEGDTVKKGDLLLRIDPVLYQSAVERMQATLSGSQANKANSEARLMQAKAQLVNAEAAYNRNDKLFNQGAISQAEFDQAKASYETAKAEVSAAEEGVNAASFNVSSTGASLKEARDNLARTSIYSPVDATVSKLNMREGEHVLGTAQMQGTEIMRLANLLEMEVLVEVNEHDILRVHLGDTSFVEVDAHDNRRFKGVVTEVANSANTSLLTGADQVTNFQVKVRILRESYADLLDPAHPERYPFLPGMSATVEIQTRRVVDVVSVPIQAVTTRTDTSAMSKGKGFTMGNDMEDEEEEQPSVEVKDKNVPAEKSDEPIVCVFVYRDGKSILVPVKTGIQDNMYIEIQSGLQEGDEVISAPFGAIRTLLRNRGDVEKVTKEQLTVIEE